MSVAENQSHRGNFPLPLTLLLPYTPTKVETLWAEFVIKYCIGTSHELQKLF